eukprot:jgi/Tetstr1/445906/TSEL_033535.t1
MASAAATAPLAALGARGARARRSARRAPVAAEPSAAAALAPADKGPTQCGVARQAEALAMAGVAAVAAVSLLSAQPASATTVFAGVYNDPNHPGCPRTIDATGKIEGVDPVPFRRGDGCTEGTKLSPPWTIQGKIDEDKGTIFIDFDQKDGSGEAFLGEWTGAGIRLPDGTVWSKTSQ